MKANTIRLLGFLAAGVVLACASLCLMDHVRPAKTPAASRMFLACLFYVPAVFAFAAICRALALGGMHRLSVRWSVARLRNVWVWVDRQQNPWRFWLRVALLGILGSSALVYCVLSIAGKCDFLFCGAP
jgi:hypothetical protein